MAQRRLEIYYLGQKVRALVPGSGGLWAEGEICLVLELEYHVKVGKKTYAVGPAELRPR